MFKEARLKLTAWYLLIVMVISSVFSLIIYRGISRELELSLVKQVIQIQPGYPPRFTTVDPQILNESKARLRLYIFYINLGILLTSGAFSYILSGITLKPIEEMMDDQKRFVSDASHELRTPLTAMRSEIEVFLMDKKTTQKDAVNLLKSNLEEVEKMQALSNYLLKLNRFQSDSVLHNEKFESIQIIDSAINKLESIAQKKNIKLINNSKNFTLNASKAAIEEVLIILIDNAIKYSHPDSEVLIKSRLGKLHYYFSVTDKGFGIKASQIPFIFNRFYRASECRTKDCTDGFGLGLSIAKNITDSHSGKILVDSTLGVGTTFTIKLPFKK